MLLRPKSRAAAFALVLAIPPSAATAQPSEPPPEIAEKVALCRTCHGEDGLPVVENVPIIAGQHMFYLLTQLRDFRAERRANDIMTPMAKELSNDEMKALATYFSEQPWPDYHEAASDADKARAQMLAVEAACTQCHLDRMLGDSRNPRVGRQKIDYTEKTLKDLRDNTRQNAAAMAAIVRAWSDEDVAAMSRYLAGL
jgi:cytochrome c553